MIDSSPAPDTVFGVAHTPDKMPSSMRNPESPARGPEANYTRRDKALIDGLSQIYIRTGTTLAVFVDQYDGQLFIQQADDCAKGWVAVAKHNKSLYANLEKLAAGGDIFLIASAHIALIGGIAMHHGWAPRGLFQSLFQRAPAAQQTAPPPTQAEQASQSLAEYYAAAQAAQQPPSAAPQSSPLGPTPDNTAGVPGASQWLQEENPAPMPAAETAYSMEDVVRYIQEQQAALAAQNVQNGGSGPGAGYNPLAMRPPQNFNPRVLSNLTSHRG